MKDTKNKSMCLILLEHIIIFDCLNKLLEPFFFYKKKKMQWFIQQYFKHIDNNNFISWKHFLYTI